MSKVNVNTVTSNGRRVRTMDNPLNLWVRDLATGKLVRVDRAAR